MDSLFRGYVETRGKKAIEKFKGRTDFKTYEQVKALDEFAGILAEDTVLIDIDDIDQAEMMMRIVEEQQLDCRVYRTTRGRHFLFKNTSGLIEKCSTGARLAVGLTADIKVGSKASYSVLKYEGIERFIEWDIEDGGEYQDAPKWLVPVKGQMEFIQMDAGAGRNQALFNYILTLQSADFSVDECRETIRIINKHLLADSLSDDEIETILRDDAFSKPVFFQKNVFLFDKFATFLKNRCHIVKINGQLHIYKDGIYVDGYKEIEAAMIRHIPNLKKSQRREVLDYLELLIPENLTLSDANYVAFRNGVLDLTCDKLMPFSPNVVLTNRIDFDYRRDAYHELTDTTLDKISCYDAEIRALMEECIGYCLYRRNELGKAFILTGDKANGKSTFLDMIKYMLGEDNVSALDLKELGDRFSSAMLFGKLANIGDDIADDFLQGSQVSIFKKIVTGNRIKAERKGQDPFEFEPYVKLLFSANDLPRMRDKTGAVLRRLVIIPFDAKFSREDPDFDPFIKYKLCRPDAIEYLIVLGIAGLKRVLSEQSFTMSSKTKAEIEEYELENNPILLFIDQIGVEEIENESTSDVYRRYVVFCHENNMTPMAHIVFSKQINKRLGFRIIDKKIDGKKTRVFISM